MNCFPVQAARVRVLAAVFLGLLGFCPLPAAVGAESEGAAADVAAQLRNVVTSWASAWQSGRYDIYLLHYHPDFVPEYLDSREAWEAQRRERITELGEISISLREFSLESLEAETAVVHFTLNYRRSGYADRTRKAMHLKLNGHLWQILREINLSVERVPQGD